MPEKNKLHNSALYYQNRGLSVIPVRPDKRPHIKWEKYQAERACPDQIHEWFKRWPDANVGIVTGGISGIAVLDADSVKGNEALQEHLSDTLETPIVKTPKGWHYWFRHAAGLRNGTRVLTDLDVRAEGGYIIAPPSVNAKGQPYTWMPGLSIADASLAELPAPLINKIKKYYRGREDNTNVFKRPQLSSTVFNLFEHGRRDEDLFHIANCLVKGGMQPDIIYKYLHFFASKCDPPYPENEISLKLESALKRAATREKNLAEEVREWVLSSSGFFLSSDVDKCLQLSSRQEKKNLSQILIRMTTEPNPIIEKSGRRNGEYRRLECECEEMNFLEAPSGKVDLTLPFGLHEKVEIMPGNIILIAGEPNAGKTAFILNTIKENMDRWKVSYFNSEMGGGELNKRLRLFGMPLKAWKFKAYERNDNFSDVIKLGPGNLNIIDFLELHENFYEVGGKLAEIHKKLNGAIAVVALQKNPGTDIGLGGFRSLEKPRLALAMSKNKIKIVKAKNWVTSENPNEQVLEWKLVNGCKFVVESSWKRET